MSAQRNTPKMDAAGMTANVSPEVLEDPRWWKRETTIFAQQFLWATDPDDELYWLGLFDEAEAELKRLKDDASPQETIYDLVAAWHDVEANNRQYAMAVLEEQNV